MRSLIHIFILMLGFTMVLPGAVYAHTTGNGGFLNGVLHPLSGPDHLLAMISIGFISTQFGSKVLWKIPALFVTCVTFGLLVAHVGVYVPFVEIGVALSVVGCGAYIALSRNLPMTWIVVCTSVFAIVHGYAHGEGLTTSAHPVAYTVGLIVSTLVLHLFGVLVGYYARVARHTIYMVRYTGVVVGVSGVLLLLGL